MREPRRMVIKGGKFSKQQRERDEKMGDAYCEICGGKLLQIDGFASDICENCETHAEFCRDCLTWYDTNKYEDCPICYGHDAVAK